MTWPGRDLKTAGGGFQSRRKPLVMAYKFSMMAIDVWFEKEQFVEQPTPMALG